ncbi:V-type ATP synthase subunit I [Halocalculus aciditolerans]|uniref:A-type ATP synthase subunit I n=1 Tax=Halocalculus aciditolerans TaxID=1383812 RepID=A0A830F2K0_9EURY|nr:V-type ATP synthase subunit I [Halocalculus aciditolerans]GGL49114.1 ATP synthase subunit I [Halocalculus aciditolerans]
MLRPEQMSKVSVTGTKGVVEDVIEVAHDENVVHLTPYAEDAEGFESGSPLEGANDAAEKLVTVRSLLSILDVSPDDAGSARIVTEDALETELEAVRQEVNELDDRRSDIEDDLAAVEEAIERTEPFVDLGLDLDLLAGYDSLEVAVGEGDAAAVEHALADASNVARFETFTGDDSDIVAVFAHPADGATDVLDDALAGVEFLAIDVPDADGSPEEHLDRLSRRKRKLQSKLDSVESELETLGLEHAGFLFAAEEELSIAVEKAEAPLQFATTEHAFVAEGWVPTSEYSSFASAVKDAVGERVEIEELERASYEPPSDHHAVADGGEEERPPVVQDNPAAMNPFAFLVRVINRPKYWEIDPTVVLFLTFPVFYGFMIGDVGYGLLYTLAGAFLYTRFDSEGIKSLGSVGMWAGGFTVLFGILYGEIFGFHVLGEVLWHGHPPIHKGLQPGYLGYAQLWLAVSIFAGVIHMTVGQAFGFITEARGHGVKTAVLENGSWVLIMVGVWGWIFSRHLADSKPDFIYEVMNGSPVALGFAGFSSTAGVVALGVALLGLLLLLAAEGALALEEALKTVTHVLSYTRLAAVMIAKAGMAFVVNLLFFGAYQYEGEFHFLTGQTAAEALQHHPEASIMFPGLVHSGIAGVLGGILVLLIGHVFVLALGVTSAGLQAIRLEYVEFFGKFYEGGGEKYEPFGHQRTHTTQD